MDQKPITQHLVDSLKRPRSQVAVRFKRHKKWLELSWTEYYQRAEAAGLALAALGIKAGDRIAIISNTRLEWAALDLGILGIGAITVPIYQSSRAEEIEYMIQNCEPRAVILEDASQLKKWEAIRPRCKSVEFVVCIESVQDMSPMIHSWDDFLDRGIKVFANNKDFFAKNVAKNQLTDLATIVYTSGTTGNPRGVMLTHQQIISEVEDLVKAFPISDKDSTLSFLPYAHVLGRSEMWLHTYLGFTMNFAESIERMKSNLAETSPTVIIGVPRIFEKINASLMTQIEGQPLRKKLFTYLSGARDPISHIVADTLIFKKLRDGLGGKLRFVVSGGAALDKSLAEFFRRAGILVLEGYGLTETTGAIIVNTPDAFEFGTIGKPFGDVEVGLAADGEILIRSQKVMKGYYKDEAATAEVLKDGWFATGDIGEWTDRGFLKITDRKKDLIKTSGGKYVAPQKLEAMLKTSPLISNVLIHGDRKKYVVALVTLNESYAKKLAKEKGWTFKDFKALTQNPALSDTVKKTIAQINSTLASFETIKNFAILPEDFTVEKGELTPSLKVKRKFADKKYRDVIESLYSH